MSASFTVSVIIPTFNRKEFLRETLHSLASQEWAATPFEVIVVDDGSEDGTEAVTAGDFPFALRYVYQVNQGDAIARNTGARLSQADVLVFLDDDVVLAPDYLRHLVDAQSEAPNRVVVGTEHLWLESSPPHLAPARADQAELVELPFAEVCSNNMSVRREAYFAVGMMRDLGFGGSSMWCDVDFTYRAFRQGYEFWRSTGATCWHRDHVFQSVDRQTRRMREVAFRAVILFQKYPELIHHVPMFEDKTPIAWGQDRPALVARKVMRPVTSSGYVLWSLEQLVRMIGKSPRLLSVRRVALRWLIGGHIYRGYRAGQRAFQAGQSPATIPARHGG
jgi:glycosyltransferase involved in cell wall biosynthesis